MPASRHETARREIVSLLTQKVMTAKELSGEVGISEKEVVDHLEHIRIALKGGLVVTRPLCLECGFTFSKRDRLRKPGRCPVCRGERIADPCFSVER